MSDDQDTQDQSANAAIPTAQSVADYLVRSLVSEPEAVNVVQIEGQRRPALAIRVAPNDAGKVIGKQGRRIKAIRTLTRAAASKDGSQVDIDVDD